jgi:hypothetical protein
VFQVTSGRFFAAAMARRAKDAIRRASASTKPSSSAPGSARLMYPYRSAVIAVEAIAAQHDFERAAAADQMSAQSAESGSSFPKNRWLISPSVSASQLECEEIHNEHTDRAFGVELLSASGSCQRRQSRDQP